MLFIKTMMASFGGFLLLTYIAAITPAHSQIRIVGSSTVFPFATVVAEQFSHRTGIKTPIIESTGSGGGLKLFCAGVTQKTPSITNASRRIKDKEVVRCAKNKVAFTEFKVGYDGIVIGNAKGSHVLNLTLVDMYKALRVGSTAKTWSDVNPSLPNIKIEVLGPPPTSGTRDAFEELVMHKACKKLGGTKKECKKESIRTDGAYIESGENDNLIVSKLTANKNAIGIFGFSFLDQNRNKIQGAKINGVKPTFDNIASGSYAISRSLWFYVKIAHVNNAIRGYVKAWFTNRAAGEDGYLLDKGLIPLSKDERTVMKKKAKAL